MNIILLSDLHIGASPDTYRRSVRTVHRIITHHDPAHTIVGVLGDLTEHGERSEYRLARDVLSPLVSRGYRLMPCPGNHDYGPFGNRYSRDAEAAYDEIICGELLGYQARWPRVYHVDGQRIITLDTCYSPPYPVDGFTGRLRAALSPARAFANGELGGGQLDALSAWLEIDAPTHILMHHHPLYAMPGLRLVDADAFLRVCEGRVSSIHFGHRHRSGVYDRGDMRIRAHGSTGHHGYMSVFALG